jgi:long-chain acyl-CoA synthetase
MFDSFAALFTHNRKKQPQGKIFATFNDRVLTYGQLDDLTARGCTLFAKRGLKQGDRVVILSRDDLAVTVLFFSCLRYGLTAVILNPAGGKAEHENLIRAAKPSLQMMDIEFIATLKPVADQSAAISVGATHKQAGMLDKILSKKATDSLLSLLYTFDPATEFSTVPLYTTAYILFTSGTTSRPKGVEVTHGNLLAQMHTFVRQYGYTAQSNILNILPLHHTDGLTQGPVVALTAGCSVYRPMRFTIDKLRQLLDSVYKYKITHWVAVPSMLQLVEALGQESNNALKTPDFKFVISTAGYLDPHLWERFEKRFGVMVVNVYGLTETVCEALYCGPDAQTRKIGTIGKPVDTQCRIVDENGHECAIGQTGELWLKGGHIMKGYFEMPSETADVLTVDGWFKTGDLCQRDADGFYSIVGRKKNIIIVGGINVYPDDVADVLRGLPNVLDAAVWGESDPTWGETVVAAVIAKGGKTLNPEVLSAAFLERADSHKMPRRIHVVEDFPRGPAGKVVIRELREMIAAQGKENVAQQSSGSLSDNVIAAAAQAFKCPASVLSLTSTAETTKGWNSLAHVEFLLNLEKQFGIRIEARDILSVRSIGDALAVVECKVA